MKCVGESLVFWNGETICLDNPIFGIIVQRGGGVWFRPLDVLVVSDSRVHFLRRWVCLVPFGERLADFRIGSVFGLRQDKIQIQSSCEADRRKDQETVGAQAFLWKSRENTIK